MFQFIPVYSSLLLIITLRFTCVERKSCLTLKKSKYIRNKIVVQDLIFSLKRGDVCFPLGTNGKTIVWYDSFMFCIFLCSQASTNVSLSSPLKTCFYSTSLSLAIEMDLLFFRIICLITNFYPRDFSDILPDCVNFLFWVLFLISRSSISMRYRTHYLIIIDKIMPET